MPLRKAKENTFDARTAALLACVSSTGRQVTAGTRLYVQEEGTTTAGKAIELIVGDDCRLPDNAKRRAQELTSPTRSKCLLA
jgi:ABC-type branched-subunit amino acid transport system substrate-binding protein